MERLFHAVALLVAFVLLSAWRSRAGIRRFDKAERRLITSSVSSVSTGLTELRGKVVLHETLEAPISKTPCAAYVVRLWEVRRDADGDVSTELVSSERRCVEFGVADLTGEMLVDPEGLELILDRQQQTEEVLDNGLQRDEVCLRADEQVVLIGHAQERAGRVVIARGPEPDAVFAVSTIRAANERRQRAQLLQEATPFALMAAAVSIVLLLMPDAQLSRLGLPTHCHAGGVLLNRQFAWMCTSIPLPVVLGPGVLLAACALMLLGILIRWTPIVFVSVTLALSLLTTIATALPVVLLLLLVGVSQPRCLLVWAAILLAQSAFAATRLEHWMGQRHESSDGAPKLRPSA